MSPATEENQRTVIGMNEFRDLVGCRSDPPHLPSISLHHPIHFWCSQRAEGLGVDWGRAPGDDQRKGKGRKRGSWSRKTARLVSTTAVVPCYCVVCLCSVLGLAVPSLAVGQEYSVNACSSRAPVLQHGDRENRVEL